MCRDRNNYFIGSRKYVTFRVLILVKILVGLWKSDQIIANIPLTLKTVNWDVTGRRGVGVASVLDAQSLFFLLKKIRFAPWPDIMLSQTLMFYWKAIFLLTLVSNSEAIHPLMIPLHCLYAKSKNRTRGQFECDVTWFCFSFDFVCLHVRCGCYSILCWGGWGDSFKIGRPRSSRWKKFGRR